MQEIPHNYVCSVRIVFGAERVRCERIGGVDRVVLAIANGRSSSETVFQCGYTRQ